MVSIFRHIKREISARTLEIIRQDNKKAWPVINPLSIERPSRKCYVQIRNLFLSRKEPSFPVRTEDLANVVNGCDEVPLPHWATNRDFERELIGLIERYRTIVICVNCDHIIGFLDYSPEEGRFTVEELLYVGGREDLSCQFCGSSFWGLAPSDFLKTGMKFEIPRGARASIRGIRDQEDFRLYLPTPTQNERYLDSILRRLYPFLPDEPTDHIRLTQRFISKSVRSVGGFSTSLASAARRLPPVFYLRPIFDKEHQNVVGSVLETVKKILQPEYAQLATAAIGILPRNELTASAHLGSEGQMAVVIRFGFFNLIYYLNQLMLYLVCGVIDRNHSREQLVSMLRGMLLRNGPKNATAMKPSELTYQSESEFWTVHAISVMQQEFVILHELGHLDAWLQKKRNVEVDNLFSKEDIAEAADIWAKFDSEQGRQVPSP